MQSCIDSDIRFNLTPTKTKYTHLNDLLINRVPLQLRRFLNRTKFYRLLTRSAPASAFANHPAIFYFCFFFVYHCLMPRRATALDTTKSLFVLYATSSSIYLKPSIYFYDISFLSFYEILLDNHFVISYIALQPISQISGGQNAI